MSQQELLEQKARLDQWELEEGFPEDDERVDQVGSLHGSGGILDSCHDGTNQQLRMFGAD